MKNFCIVTNRYKDEKLKLAQKICHYIEEKGGNCLITENVDEKTGEFQVLNPKKMPNDLECVISIGGDGTLLHAAKELIDLDFVFVGVNKGTLGFLAEISPDEIEISMDRLMCGKYNVEERMMLKGEVLREGKVIYTSTVLNDIVVHRGNDLAMISYDVCVNQQVLGNFQADGVVLSTPTGSSAYNLSAGGPVARPDSRMILLTPICPHTVANRSILLSRKDEIEIIIGASRTPKEEQRKLAFDGDGIFHIISGDHIKISEAPETTKIAKLDEGSFLQAIRDKLR